jgi:hypothetical protein
MITLKLPNIPTLKLPKLSDTYLDARFKIELWATQQRGSMAARSIKWHYKRLCRARATLNECARHEIDMFGGLPAEEEQADYEAERKNFIRIIEEVTL